jgi:hypothetical protein
MKTTVSNSDFHDAFHHANRQENFSYEARNMLFGYLEEYEQASDEELELDVIALCCEWREAETQEIIDDYSIDVEGVEPEDLDETISDYLQDHTSYIGFTEIGSHLFAAF